MTQKRSNRATKAAPRAASADTTPKVKSRKATGSEAKTPPTSTPQAQPTRAAQLLTLLSENRAVPLSEITRTFGWQPHSARAAISGLRTAGHALETSKLEGGGAAYQVTIGKEKPRSTVPTGGAQ